MTARSLEQIPLAKAHRLGPTHAAGTSFVEANDNALPLRTVIHRALRLAGRFALTQLRSVVEPCRAILPSALSDAAFMVQAGPCRVVVSVRAYNLLSVVRHQRPLAAVANDLTAGGEAGVPQPLGGSRDCAGL